MSLVRSVEREWRYFTQIVEDFSPFVFCLPQRWRTGGEAVEDARVREGREDGSELELEWVG